MTRQSKKACANSNMAALEISVICVLLLSLVLIAFGTVLIYFGATLILFFKFHLLGFLSRFYPVLPPVLIAVGGLSLMASIHGLFAALAQKKGQLLLNAFIMISIAVLHVISVFMAFEIRTYIIAQDFYSHENLNAVLQEYNDNVDEAENSWDEIQKFFMCCGGHHYQLSHTIWYNIPRFARTSSVPESCCILPSKGCGDGVLNNSNGELGSQIHQRGCLTVIESIFTQRLEPALDVYTIVGIVLALLSILAFIADISVILETRRRERKALRQRLSQQQKQQNQNQGHGKGQNKIEGEMQRPVVVTESSETL